MKTFICILFCVLIYGCADNQTSTITVHYVSHEEIAKMSGNESSLAWNQRNNDTGDCDIWMEKPNDPYAYAPQFILGHEMTDCLGNNHSPDYAVPNHIEINF